ncbi:MAG: helix-turn-helix domain-containing protein [Spirochaetaceae bacterium]|nr:MAG: helix-turn-helix domain-containing protein [Spirochaetaceae bacterium]TVQ22384.1 MAG: helix-turn-helix domain-containing protein [Spirochaetaceae bacterium]
MIRTVVVEDEPSTGTRYAQSVRDYGEPFVVSGVYESANALLCERTYVHVDLVFTDVRMPRMTGISLIERLRHDGWDGMAVVISGYGEFSLAQDAMRAGVYDYLLKPVFPADFERLLRRIEVSFLGNQGHLVSDALEGVEIELLPSFVQKAIAHAEEHLSEHMSLSSVAEVACISPAYLSSTFTRECGMSFVEFLHRVRVARAKELLSRPELSLVDVAEQSGLTDKSYLSRVFKRVTGQTPGDYRRQKLHGPRRLLDDVQ